MVVLCVIAAVLLHVVVATMAVAQCPGRLTLMIASRMESGVLWVDGSHHMVMMSTNFSDNSWASLVMHVHSELHSCTKNAHAVILFFAHEARQRVIVRISGSTVVDNHRYVTPAHNDSLGPLIRPEDRIQNLTWFVTREPILITMELVDPQNGIQGHGLIASVSYDGRLIATTGDTNSKMKFTTSSPSSTWFTSQSFDDSSWSTANVNAACSVASSPPRTNLDGYNYVSVIGANGVPPQTGGGGNIAQWVGANTNCATNTIVRYRLPLDLVTLAPEPLCLPTVDPRSFLNRGVLLISNTIGPRECTTKELKVTVVVDGEHEIYVEGYAQISEALVTKKFSAIGGRGKTAHCVDTALIVLH